MSMRTKKPNVFYLCKYETYEIQPPMTANDYYLKGNEYRKQGDFASALNNYMEAIRLDANSPAVEAKRMLDDIMNFYCKDFYNP